MKIKKNDTVLIISGKYSKKTGKVLRVFPKEEKVLVEGINLKKKHQKPKRSGDKGEIITIPAPMQVSNVKLICPKCAKAVRVGYRTEGGKKYRICKKCDKAI
ncbi:MAG: 50S ribosomal protein L24 [Patescibacteria group bacterium]